MERSRPEYLALAEFLRLKMVIKALLEGESSEETCAALQGALADIGRIAGELEATIPASFDKVVIDMMFMDVVGIIDILTATNDLSDAVLQVVAARREAAAQASAIS